MTPKQIEALKLALGQLQAGFVGNAMQILREALAEHAMHDVQRLGQEIEQEPVDLEIMASAVHDAYLTTCDALGWGVKPENRVPYSELTENSKELDRASVRAVLRLVVPPPLRQPVVCKHEWFRTGAMEPRECRCIKCGVWNT
jgi:hypothetical protein